MQPPQPNDHQQESQKKDPPVRTQTDLDLMKFRILSGNVLHYINWNDVPDNNNGPLFEVTGYLIAIVKLTEEDSKNGLNLMLRHRKDGGPVITIIQPYKLYRYIPVTQFHVGQYLRCVGKTIGDRRMLAIRITIVDPSEEVDFSRIHHVSSFRK